MSNYDRYHHPGRRAEDRHAAAGNADPAAVIQSQVNITVESGAISNVTGPVVLSLDALIRGDDASERQD